MKDGLGAFRSVPVFSVGVENDACATAAHQSLNTAFRFFLDSYDYDLSLNYRGPFQDDITSKIVDISENTILETKGATKVHRKVSFLLVECFQNIIKHSDSSPVQSDSMLSPGMFSFKNKEQAYIINSINQVKEEDIHYLRKTVDLVNAMDRDTLKRLYQRQLQRSELDSKGGAGLGLIELARRSGQNLQYEFEHRENKQAYFHQQVLFVDEDSENGSGQDYVQATKSQFQAMEDAELLMQYKGDFSQRSIIPLLHIVENNLMGAESGVQSKRIGHVLIEVLQNISKHGYAQFGKRDGIFMLGKSGGSTILVAGNIMKNDHRKKLEKHLSCLDGMKIEDLKEYHKEKIKESVFSADKSNAGLGLIEIARACQGRLAYDFRPFDQERSFFSLFVCV